MAVKIRLRRMGNRNRAFYRLVVADSRSPRDGRFIESLGHYDPLTDPATVSVDEDAVAKWVKQGAQFSDTARSLLKREGVLARIQKRSSDGTQASAPAAARQSENTPTIDEPSAASAAEEDNSAESPADPAETQ